MLGRIQKTFAREFEQYGKLKESDIVYTDYVRPLWETVTPVGIGPLKRATGSSIPTGSSAGNSDAGLLLDKGSLFGILDMIIIANHDSYLYLRIVD